MILTSVEICDFFSSSNEICSMKRSIIKKRVAAIKAKMLPSPEFTTEQLCVEMNRLHKMVLKLSGYNYCRAERKTDKIFDELIDYRWRFYG
jgi:hypothetical protein